MTITEIFETAAQTAQKIRKVLKSAFPGVKFSVTSSSYSMGSSVYVSWTDGPFSSQVNEILNQFSSGSFDGMQDMYISTGYEWKGQIVRGAKYINHDRQLSQERQAQIFNKLKEIYEAERNYRVYEWERAEKELIEAGELQGY
jgi:hypothetical protein